MAIPETRGPTHFLRFFLLIVLSVAVMIADHRTSYLDYLRSALAVLITPMQVVAAIPQKMISGVDEWLSSERSLRDINAQLRQQQIKTRMELQRLRALESENETLRKLLDASTRLPDRVLMAELVEVSLDPYTHKILVDRGIVDGVYVGQPVVDQEGVMGQVAEAMPFTAAVTLISDPSHAIPVQVQRNGLRAIAFGTGQSDQLRISYLTPNADIRPGDVLVTSGLGGRFPAGYPVARVIEVISDASEAFLRIIAKPVAKLDRTNQVLLVWHGLDKARRPSQDGRSAPPATGERVR